MTSTRLSVNINKFATLRNARGSNNPDIIKAALDCERFGAEGITVHPRPDERHIRYDDVSALARVVTTEFNIEGKPNLKFIELCLQTRPAQVTLVPDADNVLTSDTGWDTIMYQSLLTEVVQTFRKAGIRTSLFISPDLKMIENAKKTGADRIELYTEAYARSYTTDKEKAVAPYRDAAIFASEIGLGINAGHDLDLNNLAWFRSQVPGLLEVSIGHALICDALYLGLENTIQLYLRQLK